jgi:hypothetical protein
MLILSMFPPKPALLLLITLLEQTAQVLQIRLRESLALDKVSQQWFE